MKVLISFVSEFIFNLEDSILVDPAHVLPFRDFKTTPPVVILTTGISGLTASSFVYMFQTKSSNNNESGFYRCFLYIACKMYALLQKYSLKVGRLL